MKISFFAISILVAVVGGAGNASPNARNAKAVGNLMVDLMSNNYNTDKSAVLHEAQSREEEEERQRTRRRDNGDKDDSALPEANIDLSQVSHMQQIQDALKVMQDTYFELWIGGWPTAIDWTAAVMNTFISSTLATLSHYLRSSPFDTRLSAQIENQIDQYFAQSTAFYFGENAFALRNQAYDDMFWVVLGWLESVRFITSHDEERADRTSFTTPWHGKQYVAAFSHRARIFYDLAARGWDERLCGGGMVWNPRLEPYKNAITNQLFIAASVSMYLYFPGDDNASPYLAHDVGAEGFIPARPHDGMYLDAAIKAYTWLRESNMTNDIGLYVDGFHVTGWSRKNETGSGKCDDRNEMVYSYNQGVVLSGLRGLWEATGKFEYLRDGHDLIRNVVNATGWTGAGNETGWAGLGRSGILEEYCDHSGDCSQDGQTFKGIFFHHLAEFCRPLPQTPLIPGKTYTAGKDLTFLHQTSCQEYAQWVEHNARAALRRRDRKGRFGAFWGHQAASEEAIVSLPDGAMDYRNDPSIFESSAWDGTSFSRGFPMQQQQRDSTSDPLPLRAHVGGHDSRRAMEASDINDRGRGRTVETQGGGLSVLRASWELSLGT